MEKETFPARQSLPTKTMAYVSKHVARVVDFTRTMTVGSYTEQLERTKATPNTEPEFYGTAFYGDIEAVSVLTKKFSLFR